MKSSFLAVIVGVMLVGCGGADTSSQALAREQASSAMKVGATKCDTGDGWWEGRTIEGSLVVPAGATCRLSWCEVKGNTSVNGNLLTIGTTFDGNVEVDGGSLAGENWGSTFLRNVSITNSKGSTVPGGSDQNGFWGDYSPTTIGGNFSYEGNSVPLYLNGPNTTVKGNFEYSGSPCGSTPTVMGHSEISCD